MLALLLAGCTSGDPGGPSVEHPPRADLPSAVAQPPFVEEVPRADAYLFGDTTLDIALTLDEDAIEALADSRQEAKNAPFVPATFTLGADTYTVTLRLKGGMGSFRPYWDKPSFRIDFSGVDPDGDLHGLRWLILNNLIQDKSMLGEHLAYETYRILGLPAGRHGFARVSINGELFGLYGVVEAVEHDLLERYWPTDADGLLIEGGVDFVPGDEEGFKTPQDGDQTPLYDAVAALDAAPPDRYFATLGEWFEADQLLDVWAIELATGNPDAYVTRHNNYYVYWRPDAARWVMLPWGTDTAFLDPLEWSEDWYEGELYLKCLAAPACEEALRGRLAKVAAWWDTGEIHALVETVAARTEADCMADPRSDGGADGCASARHRLRGFVEDRGAELEAILGE